jgi:hypothetical protein
MVDGLTIETLNGILIYTFSDSSEEAINAWEDDIVSMIEALPMEQSFCVLMDVSQPQVSFSRHARQKSQLIFSRYRAHKGRFAFLFSSKTAPHYARIFFASLGRLQFELQFFSSREKALSWLRRS